MATNPAKLVVGYFPGWVIHAPGYHVADIPASTLSHVVYASATVSTNGECVSTSTQDDTINFPALQRLKRREPLLKTLISVGGASHSASFSKAVRTATARQSLAQSCVNFMQLSGFDGIDIDWEFPGAPDKGHYTAFVQELRRQLDAQGATDSKKYLLTATLPAVPDKYANFDLSQIHAHLDWINLMAFAFYPPTNSTTELLAPLHPSPTNPETDPIKRASYYVDAAVKAYLALEVPPAKVVVGVSFLGQGWSGVANTNNGLYQSATAPANGTAQRDGIFSYNDLASNYLGTYGRLWNSEASSPWLYNPETGVMIGYDDPQSLGIKADYVNTNNLGSIAIWQLSADDNQSSLVKLLAARLNPVSAPSTGVSKSQVPNDLSRYAGILPYDTETFGVYRPLLNWFGHRASTRVATAHASAAADVTASMAKDLSLVGGGTNINDPLSSVHLQLAGAFQSDLGRSIADAASEIVNRTGQPPTPYDWEQLLSQDNIARTLSQVLASTPQPAGSQPPALRGLSLADSAGMSTATSPAGRTVGPNRAQLEIASANFLTWAVKHSPDTLNALFLTDRPLWRTSINFINPFVSTPGASAVLSPVGFINLYREYFYQLDTFLGPPVGHVWVSPGGSLELYEVSTRKTTITQTTEASTTQTAKDEIDTTNQDELSTSVKTDNKNDTKLGVSANTNGGFRGIVEASASATFNVDSSTQSSSEEAHKHSRTQSEKLSKEITQNFKTTFQTVTETTVTTSRRYVLANTTDKLANYELRRKLRLIGVQLQHIGTRLSWQVYVQKLLAAIAALDTDLPAAPRDAPLRADAERRQLTIMFCDLVGSTALSARLDPADLREVIAAYHRAVAQIVAGFDGFVAKYMGDGVLVYFGYPRAHEDDGERAVRTGLGLIDAVGGLDVKSVKLQARVGIATGLVVVGDLIGEGSAQEQSVVGETPNLAARAEMLAGEHGFAFSSETLRKWVTEDRLSLDRKRRRLAALA
jgi:GH18 family chitinase/class 3 adenylate cyclase